MTNESVYCRVVGGNLDHDGKIVGGKTEVDTHNYFYQDEYRASAPGFYSIDFSFSTTDKHDSAIVMAAVNNVTRPDTTFASVNPPTNESGSTSYSGTIRIPGVASGDRLSLRVTGVKNIYNITITYHRYSLLAEPQFNMPLVRFDPWPSSPYNYNVKSVEIMVDGTYAIDGIKSVTVKNGRVTLNFG